MSIERPHPGLMTKTTFKRLEKELEQVRTKSKELMQGTGKESSGDADPYHDNAARDKAKEDLRVLDDWERTLLNYLSRVEIIKPRKDISKAGIGNEIDIKFIPDTQVETFTILGPADTGTRKGEWISYESPLALAVIGHCVNEELQMNNGVKFLLAAIRPGKFK